MTRDAPAAPGPLPPVIARRATEQDAAQLCVVRALSIRVGAASHYSPEAVRAWLGERTAEHYLEPIRTKMVLVAVVDAQIHGFIQLDAERALIEALYVAPAAMRQGIGTRLLAQAEALATALGCVRLRLDASYNAVAFYQRAGYIAVHDATPRSDCVAMIKRDLPA